MDTKNIKKHDKISVFYFEYFHLKECDKEELNGVGGRRRGTRTLSVQTTNCNSVRSKYSIQLPPIIKFLLISRF